MRAIRILLDQNAPLGLRRVLPDHEVIHADELGWGRLRNGDLIEAAEAAGFSVLVTCDRNIPYQQKITGRRLAVIELSGGGWPTIRNHLDRVVAAIEVAQPGAYTIVTFPRAPLRRRPWPRLEC